MNKLESGWIGKGALILMMAISYICLNLPVASAQEQVPRISGVGATQITDSSAVIVWTTDVASRSEVDYGTSTDYVFFVLDGNEVTSHSVMLTGLAPQTLYHYQVMSVIVDGSPAIAGDFQFTTLEPQIPKISGVGVTQVTDASAVIVWTTDLASDSRVDYGIDTSYGNIEYDPKLVTSHSILLTQLLPEALYHFQVLSKTSDIGEHGVSADMQFSTTTSGCGRAYDITITNITPSSISAGPPSKQLVASFTSSEVYQYTRDQFKIIWNPLNSSNTDQRSDLSPTSLDGSGTNWTLTFQSGPLSQPSQPILVSFSVSYPPCAGNPQTVFSNVYEGFSADDIPLDTTPPRISGVHVTEITTSTIAVDWDTDEASDARLEFGKTTAYGGLISNSVLTTTHSFRLTGLEPGSLYHFRVSSTDEAGNQEVSGDYTFTTGGGIPGTIERLSPDSALEGDPPFFLNVFGGGFTENAVVLWNGSSRVTRFVTNNQLVAAIPTGDITTPGTFQVSVRDSNSSTDSLPFTVTVNNLPPNLTGILPAYISTQGNTKIHLLGRNFKPEMVQTTQFLIGGKPVTGLTFVNSTQLDATAPANPEGPSEVTMASFTGPQGQHSLKSTAEQGSEVGLIYRPFPPVPPTKPGYIRQRIPFVIDSDQFRTNLGINNLGGSAASVEILMADNNGDLVVGRNSVTIPAHGMTQISNVVRCLEREIPISQCGNESEILGREGYLLLESPAGNSFVAWASQIDNATTDPSMEQSGTESLAASQILLPTSASLNQFRTSLIVVNNSPSAGQVQIRSYNAGNGAVQATLTREIDRYGFLSFEDFYRETGKSNVFGPIVIEATGGMKVTASARIYTNILTSGYLEGVDVTGASTRAILPYSITSPDFRTNIGITNPGANPANVTVELINKDGEVEGSITRTITPHGMTQVNDVNVSLSNNTSASGLEGYLRVDSDQPIFAWSSQIDNQTQDTSMVVGKSSTSSTSTELLIPSATRAGSFRSTLAVVNLADAQTQVQITARDSGGNITGSSQRVIPPNGFISYTDVLASLNLVNVFGPLEVRSLDNHPLLLVSRVYSTQRTGGYFEGVPLTP